MTEVGSFLYRDSVPITDEIAIRIPSVGEIIDDEDNYYTLVTMLTAQPMDFMVQLDDIGIKFDEINSFELFMLLSNGILARDTKLIFRDLDMSNFGVGHNLDTGEPVLYDDVNDIVIDRVVHTKISLALRKIHHLEQKNKRPGNDEARKYMIDRARTKAGRKKKKSGDSSLEPLIIAMVNTEQFKYRFEDVRNLSIYQFNESVRQIQHKVDYDNRMFGIYSGTIDPKGLSQNDLNWLIHK